jgi:transcriptional regulator with PAS, ATPase and Fis domain
MTATGSEAGTQRLLSPRQHERRRGLEELLAALARGLGRRSDVSLMRGTLEQLLRRVVPVRSVHIRDLTGRWSRSKDENIGLESISLEIPGVDTATQRLLEATFDPGCPLGEWDFQMLGVATNLAALVLEIERTRTLLARARLLTGIRQRSDGASPLVGSTSAMQVLRTAIGRVASTDFTVLLEGESGVGKELVARQIHDLSRRRHGPFVAINCAALVETLLEAELFGIEDRTATGVRGRRGKFEHADGGTLFLDEVSDLSLPAQAKLLRAIQDFAVERVGGRGSHPVDIRIIAATNRRLSDLVERGAFRPDLFYRLSGVDVRVPTLRERRPDILELANHFLDRHRASRDWRLAPESADALTAYAWPGNVRELERLMERAVTVATHDVIELEDLPPAVRGDQAAVLGLSLRHNETMRAWGSRYARLVLERSGGNKREACRVLGISYHTLQAYLRYPMHEPRADADEEWTGDAEVAAAAEAG